MKKYAAWLRLKWDRSEVMFNAYKCAALRFEANNSCATRCALLDKIMLNRRLGLVFSDNVRGDKSSNGKRFSYTAQVPSHRTAFEFARILNRIQLPEGLKNESRAQM